MGDKLPMRDLRPCDGCGGQLVQSHGHGVFRRVTVEAFGIGAEVHRGMGAIQMMGGSRAVADAMGLLPSLDALGPAETVILCGVCYLKSDLPVAQETAASFAARRNINAKIKPVEAPRG